MESTSTATSRFRFRDYNQEMGDDDSSEGHTSVDSSSVSSDENVEAELQSMTAKGVQHLCSELLELKEESDLDFQKSIFSNYSAFLVIFKEIEGLQSELLQLKYQASSQKKLVKDLRDGIALRVLSEETIGSMLEEPLHVQLSSPSILETHTDNVSELLDTLLSEHRVDDALALLEMEDCYFRSLRLEENFSSNDLMSYNSMISEKRAMLSDQITLVANNPRVSAPELQKALLHLCQLGDSNLATQLLLQYYHSRIKSGIHNLQSSKEFLDLLYIQEVAKFVCSMISQAARTFASLNGETSPHDSDLFQWAEEQIGVFAACFSKYVSSISETSGRLSTAGEAMQIAMSYCSLPESQKFILQPSLMKYICPCIEEVFQVHIEHFRQVVSIFTSTDTWVLGRYFGTGIITETSYTITDQQPEYIYLTNSGRKFVTLFQSFTEDVSSLVALQMESSVLKGIMDLFTAYTVILESAILGDTDVAEKGGFKVNFPESPVQEVSILVSLSTLVQLVSSIIKNIFDGIHHLDFEIDNYLLFIQDTCSRLRSCFIEEFINNIFSPDVDHQCVPENRISWQDNSKIYNLVPSPTHLELYIELKKLQKLAGDDYVDNDWLMALLEELVGATFAWISSKSEIWTISKEDLADHCTDFMQFILDTQFLVEIARFGGYLSDDIINAFLDIISRLESSFISSGFNPVRDLNDDGWPGNAAVKAIEKLQELEERELLENENSSTPGKEPLGLVNDVLLKDATAARLSTDFIESVQNSATQNASEFAIDTDTEIPRVKDNLIEDDINLEKEVDFCDTRATETGNGDFEAEKNKFRSRDEIFLPEACSDVGDDGDTCQWEMSNQSDCVELGTGIYLEEECLPRNEAMLMGNKDNN
ncbi:Exocyst complex component EXO84A [Forsythia ovata]|uniref:Exocyst complex component EXO84A n=1 Tax=Forsythia ovata TaxID=205694 RepID=A0ABD1RHL4_9LAMI